MTETLSLAAGICEKAGITLLLEPFNTKVDHPDYFLDNPELALHVLKEVGSNNAKMLFDIYHMQIMSGNVTAFIKENIDYIGHFHVAGVPGAPQELSQTGAVGTVKHLLHGAAAAMAAPNNPLTGRCRHAILRQPQWAVAS